MSLPRRLARLEAMLTAAASKPIRLRDLSDTELWAIILEHAGLPATADNIALHEAYNADRLDTVWVSRNGSWIDCLAGNDGARRNSKKGNHDA